MAKARLVVADQNSAELDQLRRSVNALMVVLENIGTQVADGDITAAEGLEVLGLTLGTGKDTSVAAVGGGANTYVGTGRELVGVHPTPLHPKQVRGALRSMTKDTEF